MDLNKLISAMTQSGLTSGLAVSDVANALEVYAASLLAIDETRVQGRVYLEALAGRLQLPAPLIGQLHAEAATPDRAA